MQVTRRGAVLVPHVAADNRAQAFNIEIGVLDFERIKSPLDELNATRHGVFTLPEFQTAPDSEVAILRQHAQHMAVQIGLAARLQAGNGHAKCDQTTGFIEFASDLYDQQPQRPENLAVLAATKGLAAKVSAPFGSDLPPDEIGIVKGFTQSAFALTSEEPFAGPLVGSDAVYVIAMNKRIPSDIPPLDQIRSQVEMDCRYTRAAQMARMMGAQFSSSLTNGLAQGKTFAGIATDSKVKPTVLPPFSLSTKELPEVEGLINLNQLKQIVFDTPVGKASSFVPTREGGLVVFVQRHLSLDDAKMHAEMPEFLKSVRQARQNEAVNLWYRREAEKSMRDTLLQTRPPSMAPGQSRS